MLPSRTSRRICSRLWRWVACAALILLIARAVPPPTVTTVARFPRTAPSKLAHMLADFSTHLLLYPHLGEWTLEDESSNFTSWSYSVSYSCGASCSGRAVVLARDVHGPGAVPGQAELSAYTIRVTHTACTSLILPWIKNCEKWETETHVSGDGTGGAVMRESVRSGCTGWFGARALVGICNRELRASRDQHLERLRAILQYAHAAQA